MALAQDTPILLLDEPTTYLDLAHQLEVLDLLADLNEQGRTIGIVLHDLNHACRYAHHLVALRDGRVHAAGAPEAIVDEELVQAVFGLRARVLPDPVTGTPMCVPIGAPSQEPRSDVRPMRNQTRASSASTPHESASRSTNCSPQPPRAGRGSGVAMDRRAALVGDLSPDAVGAGLDGQADLAFAVPEGVRDQLGDHDVRVLELFARRATSRAPSRSVVLTPQSPPAEAAPGWWCPSTGPPLKTSDCEHTPMRRQSARPCSARDLSDRPRRGGRGDRRRRLLRARRHRARTARARPWTTGARRPRRSARRSRPTAPTLLGDDLFAGERVLARVSAWDGPQGAKMALDGVLHDWLGKRVGQPVWRLLGTERVTPPTSYTIGIDSVEGTADRTRRATGYEVLKIKVGGPGDLERLRAVRAETARAAAHRRQRGLGPRHRPRAHARADRARRRVRRAALPGAGPGRLPRATGSSNAACRC